VRVPYGERGSDPQRPRVMRVRREASREALTGVCVGQAVSGESNAVRGADAVVAAEGNKGGSDSARILPLRVVWDPGMHIRLLHGNRESSVTALRGRFAGPHREDRRS
jgi:hypothetical protein